MRGIVRYKDQFTAGKPNTNYMTSKDVDYAMVDFLKTGVIGYIDRIIKVDKARIATIKEVDIAIFVAQVNSRSPDVPKD